jgi:flagellar motor switch protein FliG
MNLLSPSIRKAAVLVWALDERAADALLDQMPPETARRVRAAIMELGDVSQAEQESVLAEFLRRPSTATTRAGSESGVELDPALAARMAENDGEPPRVTTAAHDPSAQPVSGQFEFLRRVPPSAIHRVLAGEHEQTIALIVSRLDVDLAAQVLEQLPAERATTVLERLACLQEPAPEVLAEIDRHLQTELAADASAAGTPTQSLASLQALLGAMDFAARDRILAGLGRRNSTLARELGRSAPAVAGALQPAASPAVDADRYEVSAFRYRIDRSEPVRSTTIEFDEFALLSDEALRQVLAAAEPHTALVALTGADQALISRILAPLPPRDAAILRRRLTQSSDTQSSAARTSEIEAARQQLAAIACHLAAEATIDLPPSRRFAAAA